MILPADIQAAVAIAGRIRRQHAAGAGPAWVRFPEPVVARPFGGLTAAVRTMKGEFAEEDVLDTIPAGNPVARCEVSQLLNRLMKRGQVERFQSGRRWLYRVTEAGRRAQEKAKQG